MVTLDSSMEVSPMWEESKSAGMRLGEQSVIRDGAPLMLMLLADNLAMLLLVCSYREKQTLFKVMSNIMMPIGTPRYNAFYGQGSGLLLLNDIICLGTEDRLYNCQHGGIGMTDFCRGHLDDAGLDCRESKIN